MPFRIDGRGDMNAFVLTSPLAGVMLLTRRQPFYPSAAHDKFFSICTAFGGYTKFGIAPQKRWCCADLHIFQTPRGISNLEFLKNWRKCFIELVREFFLLNYAKKDSVTLNQLCFHIFS